MIGSAISHYRIVDKLGEGGMGVVYKAEDTKLERTVALKFLAAHLLNDDEAKQRFLREAKAAAALTHPNICHVYEIDEEEGKTFISMAFVEGETLEDRISRGPLPIKDALDIGQQIAKGLQAAHEKGIVHRDIKPANILVAQDGQVTIMDFGLARLTEASRLTKADSTMGTVAYMSPEQAQGAEVDHRCDVWALGCVLYEMVAGQRTFTGQYDQALLYEVVNQEPEPLTAVRAGVPMELEFIAGKCLAKDAGDRYQHASEIAVDLRTLSEKLKSGRSTILRTTNLAQTPANRTVNPVETLPPDVMQVRRSRHRALQVGATAGVLGFLAVLALHLGEPAPETPARPVSRFSFDPQSSSPTSSIGGPRPSISPDGKNILYIVYDAEGQSSLWIRPLASEFPRQLDRTEGAVRGFWSPDSQSVAFGTESELKRMTIDGGIPITLCPYPAPTFRGGTWSPDGETIAFSVDAALYRVPARGGAPEHLLGERLQGWDPLFLPSSTPALVFTRGLPNDSRLAILNMNSGEAVELRQGDDPGYSAGHIIHGAGDDRESGVWAMPFSLDTLTPTGESFPIETQGRRPTVSADGTLTYEDHAPQDGAEWALVWRSRTGEPLQKIGQPQSAMGRPVLSPDGARVAVASNEGGDIDIWVHDLVRSTKSRLTFADGDELSPAWSPSGEEIVYSVGGAGLERKAADGTGDPTILTEIGGNPDWSRDGHYVFYQSPGRAADIFYVELSRDGAAGEPTAFLSEPGGQRAPKLSPDGRFVAYTSDESGRNEIYVRPFPNGAGKWQASTEGGLRPRWRDDGAELFYTNGADLMAVSVSTAAGLTLGQPQRLFSSPDIGEAAGSPPTYDVTPDGQRFVTITRGGESESETSDKAESEPPKVRVVQNWFEEFRDRQQ